MRKRLALLLTMAAVAILAATAALPSLAQEGPEFQLGFKDLADLAPNVAGQPMEAEWHNAENGDGLQQTTTGLMVWRKADNWTAFTDGATTWINGPLGLESRPNDQRFPWEAQPAAPTAVPTAAPAATPAPSQPPVVPTVSVPDPLPAAPVPTPVLRLSELNTVQGASLEAGTVWLMGEMRNEGPNPAFGITITGRLLAATGEVVGTATQIYPYLGPGESLGYRVSVRQNVDFARAEVSTSSSVPAHPVSYQRLPATMLPISEMKDDDLGFRSTLEGTVLNNTGRNLAAGYIYVWFLDDQDRVVWADLRFTAPGLAMGQSHGYLMDTPWERNNPRVGDVSQVKVYAFGRP